MVFLGERYGTPEEGRAAYEQTLAVQSEMADACTRLKCTPDQLLGKIDALLEEIKEEERSIRWWLSNFEYSEAALIDLLGPDYREVYLGNPDDSTV